MTPHLIVVGGVVVHRGDCRTILAGLPDNFVDSIVTDPPYELGFMGKKWDASGVAYDTDLWSHAMRVLKPGGHLLAFGGTRTYHRMAVAIEDAGFEIRDSIHWVYGSGFPKSMDVSKAIDKAAGAERHLGRVLRSDAPKGHSFAGKVYRQDGLDLVELRESFPATEDAARWQGWGTALKPAHEPIVLARKPLIGTVADNVLRYGTGAINIDATRIGTTDVLPDAGGEQVITNNVLGKGLGVSSGRSAELGGRWPANIVHDGSDEVLAEFPNAGGGYGIRGKGRSVYGDGLDAETGQTVGYGDKGSAARFFASFTFNDTDARSFIYVAKSSTAERNAGLDHLDSRIINTDTPPSTKGAESSRAGAGRNGATKNFHPTVKPLALMRYLIRLVTPPGGIVLEPFAGSGTTFAAATLEGHPAIGIELTDDYLPIIEARIRWANEHHAPPTGNDTPPATTQPTLFDTEEAA